MSRRARLVPAMWLLLSAAALPLAAQGTDRGALASYYRAVGEHFRVPSDEILILSEWRLPPDEIPVVLWVARRTGIPAEALVAQRQAGRDWADVARRYALDATAFHVDLDDGAGSLASVYEAYRDRPSGQWSSIQLDDGAIVGLVNLRVLAEILRTNPSTLLQTRDRTGSWVDAYQTLARR